MGVLELVLDPRVARVHGIRDLDDRHASCARGAMQVREGRHVARHGGDIEAGDGCEAVVEDERRDGEVAPVLLSEPAVGALEPDDEVEAVVGHVHRPVCRVETCEAAEGRHGHRPHLQGQLEDAGRGDGWQDIGLGSPEPRRDDHTGRVGEPHAGVHEPGDGRDELLVRGGPAPGEDPHLDRHELVVTGERGGEVEVGGRVTECCGCRAGSAPAAPAGDAVGAACSALADRARQGALVPVEVRDDDATGVVRPGRPLVRAAGEQTITVEVGVQLQAR